MLKNISLKAKWAIGLACAVALLLVCAVVVYLANY